MDYSLFLSKEISMSLYHYYVNSFYKTLNFILSIPSVSNKNYRTTGMFGLNLCSVELKYQRKYCLKRIAKSFSKKVVMQVTAQGFNNCASDIFTNRLRKKQKKKLHEMQNTK